MNSMYLAKSLGRLAAILIVAGSALTGCSSVSIDSAKALAKTGRDTAVAAQKGTRASDDDFTRTMMSEAYLHGSSGSTQSPLYLQMLSTYEAIQREFVSRNTVLERLTDVYDAFEELASLDSGPATEKALGELGGAINAYASTIKATPPISDKGIGLISAIGGLAAAEAQKRKLAEASREIRSHVKAFADLLATPLVAEQHKGFQSLLIKDRKAALIQLWRAGVYDPTPLINELGKDTGLTALKDVAAVATPQAQTMAGLEGILEWHFRRRQQQMERAYNATVASLHRLTAEHEKFERGEAMDLARIREQVAQVRTIADQLSK